MYSHFNRSAPSPLSLPLSLPPSLPLSLPPSLPPSLPLDVALCLVVATQRVVVATLAPAWSPLSFSRHMPHTHDPFNALPFPY